MKTVLFAWELEANLGHAVPIARIAAELAGEELRLVFAVCDLAYARSALGSDALPILQAPLWPHHRPLYQADPMASYADVLAAVGFGDPLKLDATVRAWSDLLNLVKPNLIVADHSPALLVATYGGDVPVVAIGTGFTMPPLGLDRLPPLRADRAPAMPEARLLDSARQVQKGRGGKQPSTLLDIFRKKGRFVFGIPELDPYRSFRNEPMHAPPEGLPAYREPEAERRLFVYIGAETPQLELLAQVLAGLDTTVEAYLRGETGSVGEFLRMRGHVVHDRPPDLGEALGRSSHVLSQGDAFTTAAAFSAGRPQLVMALHNEAWLNVQFLRQFGVVRQLEPNATREAMEGELLRFLGDHDARESAREQAMRIAGRSLPDGRTALAAAIRRLLS